MSLSRHKAQTFDYMEHIFEYRHYLPQQPLQPSPPPQGKQIQKQTNETKQKNDVCKIIINK